MTILNPGAQDGGIGVQPKADEAYALTLRRPLDGLAHLVLVDNPEYIPSTLRKSQATTIESITEDMARVRREIDRVQHLAATIQTIQAAAASEETTAAYAARQELLDKYVPNWRQR